MIVKISVILDVKKQVIRTFLIDSSRLLSDLHETIKKVFDFKGNEFASCYRIDAHGEKKGEDIHLFAGMTDIEDGVEEKTMENTPIKEVLQNPNDALLYTYGMMTISLWRFQVIYIEKSDEVLGKKEAFRLMASCGAVPEGAGSTKEQDAVLLDGEGDDFFDEFEPLPDDIY